MRWITNYNGSFGLNPLHELHLNCARWVLTMTQQWVPLPVIVFSAHDNAVDDNAQITQMVMVAVASTYNPYFTLYADYVHLFQIYNTHMQICAQIS